MNPSSSTATRTPACASRRTVLTCAAGGLSVVALTACTSAASNATSEVGTAPSMAGAVLAQISDVPVGGGVVVGDVVITQPDPGTFRAFDAACPHRGVIVAAPRDGVIVCAAHDSRFSVTDGGRISGPADGGLTQVPIRVDGTGLVRD